jgi:hypothetical protein
MKDLESIGYHFLDSLLDYCDPDETKVSVIVLLLSSEDFHEMNSNMPYFRLAYDQ